MSATEKWIIKKGKQYFCHGYKYSDSKADVWIYSEKPKLSDAVAEYAHVVRLVPKKPLCTRCRKLITDGYMIGDGDGSGRKFAHPACFRATPGQTAHAAYDAAGGFVPSWESLSVEARARWESVASAVVEEHEYRAGRRTRPS